MVGQNVGKYRVLDRVGRGGMGTVYRAIDETLHREVAIKVLNAELNDPEVARRFRAEAITVARLSHPGIATIYELFQHEEQWLMVMEFVRGDTLEQLISRDGPLPAERAALLSMQCLAALAHAHSMGVVHRDLKPANIMVTDAGDIKIMDFGIARVAGTEHLTTVGFMMGTPAYMAPEQVLGNDIDARSDLYAIGVVFYRLVSGQLPFKGDTPFLMAQAQVSAPPTPIASVRTDLPAWVAPILARALAKQPDARFQSAADFHESLERALAGAGTPATHRSLAPAGLVATPARPMPTVAQPEPTERSERPEPLTSARVEPLASTLPPPDIESAPTVATPVVLERPVRQAAQVSHAPVAPHPVATPWWNRTSLLALGAVALALAVGVWWLLRDGDTEQGAPQVASAAVAGEGALDTPVRADLDLPPPVPVPAPAPSSAPAGRQRPVTPASAGAVAAASEAIPPDDAPGSADAAAVGDNSGDAAEPDADPSEAARVEVADIKVMVLDGRKANDIDARLSFDAARFEAVAPGNADRDELVSWPYGDVVSATYIHARDPRWEPGLASPPDDLDVGGIFRSSRHWLTLQNAERFVILRLEDINVIQVIREFEDRTGLTIRRTSSDQ